MCLDENHKNSNNRRKDGFRWEENLIMEYYRHIDRDKIQFDFICDSDSQAIPFEEIEELGGRVSK